MQAQMALPPPPPLPAAASDSRALADAFLDSLVSSDNTAVPPQGAHNTKTCQVYDA